MTVRIIAFRPVYNTLFNNPSKSILLSQLQYLDDHKSLKRWGETWFVRTSEELAEEIGYHSAKSIGNWLREFSKMGIIKVRRAFLKGINQLWMQLDHHKIKDLLKASGADLSLLDDSPAQDKTPDSNVSQTELSNEHNIPEAELDDDNNLPQKELDRGSNFPRTELSAEVTSLSGNPISENISLKRSDQDQKDQIRRSDDDGFIRQHLSGSQIAEVTRRVNLRYEQLKTSADPIRNKSRYLKMALKNEAEKVVAEKEAAEIRRKEYAEYAMNTSGSEPEIIEEVLNNIHVPTFSTWAFPSDEIWDATAAKIKERWDDNNFAVWIKPVRFMEKSDTKYVIGVPNVPIADMLQYRLYDDVKTALCESAQQDLEIQFVVRHELKHMEPTE